MSNRITRLKPAPNSATSVNFNQTADEFVKSLEPFPDQANALADEVEQNATNAKASETAAKASEEKAKASEEKAKASEEKAKASEEKAKASEEKAKISETEAKKSETKAKESEGIVTQAESRINELKQGLEKSKETLQKIEDAVSGGFIDDAQVSDKTAFSSQKTEEKITNSERKLSEALNSKLDISTKNKPNGYAGLDDNGKLPTSVLPKGHTGLDGIIDPKRFENRFGFLDNKFTKHGTVEYRCPNIQGISNIPDGYRYKHGKNLAIFEHINDKRVIEWGTNVNPGSDPSFADNLVFSGNLSLKVMKFCFSEKLAVFYDEPNVVYGPIKVSYRSQGSGTLQHSINRHEFPKNIKNIFFDKESNFFVQLEDNSVYVAGDNLKGVLGIGTKTSVYSWTKHSFFDDKELIEVFYDYQSNHLFFYCKLPSGELNIYVAGYAGSLGDKLSPSLVVENVDFVFSNTAFSGVLPGYVKGGKLYLLSYSSPSFDSSLYKKITHEHFYSFEINKQKNVPFENVVSVCRGYGGTLLILLSTGELYVYALPIVNDLDLSNPVDIYNYTINSKKTFYLLFNGVSEIRGDELHSLIIVIKNNNEVYILPSYAPSSSSDLWKYPHFTSGNPKLNRVQNVGYLNYGETKKYALSKLKVNFLADVLLSGKYIYYQNRLVYIKDNRYIVETNFYSGDNSSQEDFVYKTFPLPPATQE